MKAKEYALLIQDNKIESSEKVFDLLVDELNLSARSRHTTARYTEPGILNTDPSLWIEFIKKSRAIYDQEPSIFIDRNWFINILKQRMFEAPKVKDLFAEIEKIPRYDASKMAFKTPGEYWYEILNFKI